MKKFSSIVLGIFAAFAICSCNDEEAKSYFELKIHYNELTTDHTLEVTDFAEPGEEEDVRSLWDSQIETLKRVFGV